MARTFEVLGSTSSVFQRRGQDHESWMFARAGGASDKKGLVANASILDDGVLSEASMKVTKQVFLLLCQVARHMDQGMAEVRADTWGY